MIPKVVVKESGPPEGMAQEQLDKILRPNFLALSRIIARDIKKDQERQQRRLKEANKNVDSV